MTSKTASSSSTRTRRTSSSTSFSAISRSSRFARLRDELADAGIRSKRRTAARRLRLWRPELFPRGALSDAAEPSLPRRDPHKGNAYPGEHAAIVDEPLWDEVQAALAANRVERATGARASSPSLLTGMVFDEERRAPDADPCGQEGNALPLLCFDLPRHRGRKEPVERPADTGGQSGRPGDQQASHLSCRPRSSPRRPRQ